MSERPPRKAVKKETTPLQSETEQQFLDHLASAVQAEAEKKLHLGHDLMPQEIREKLDQIGNNPNSTLESFDALLRDAEEAGGGALSLTWLEDIGKTAATQLRGKDFNAFKRHVTKKYELNEKGIPELHPELDFLRIKPKSKEKSSSTDNKDTLKEDMPVPAVGSQEHLPPTNSESDNHNVIDAEYTVLENTSVPVPPDALKSHDQIAMEKVGLEYHAPKTSSETPSGDKHKPSTESVTTESSESERPYLFSESARREFEQIEKDLTPFEWKGYLKELIHKFTGSRSEKKESVGGERLKEYLDNRSKDLGKEALKYGGLFAEGLGNVAEAYNKLGWKEKLALTGVLTIGAGVTAAVAPLASQVLIGTLATQRAVSGIGTFLNRRKDLDRWEWSKNHSDRTKNVSALALTLAWTYGSAYVVREAVDMVGTIAQKVDLDQAWESAKDRFQEVKEEVGQWSEKFRGHTESSAPVPPENISDVAKNIASDSISPPSPDEAVSTEDSLEDMEAKFREELAPGEEPKPFEGTMEEMEKTTDEILQYNGPVSDYFKETYGGPVNLAPTEEYVKTLAADSLVPNLASGDQALIDKHVASLLQRGQTEFKKYVEQFTLNPDSMPVTGARSEEYTDAVLKKHIDKLAELSKESAEVQGLTPEQLEEVNAELSELRANKSVDGDSVDAAIERAKEHLQNISRLSKESEKVSILVPEAASADVTQDHIPEPSPLADHAMTEKEAKEAIKWPKENKEQSSSISKFWDWATGGSVETNANGLQIDTAHAVAYLDENKNHIIFGGSVEERAKEAAKLLMADTKVKEVYFDSTQPRGLFNLFPTHHITQATLQEGKIVMIDDTMNRSLPANLPSINDLKEVYKFKK